MSERDCDGCGAPASISIDYCFCGRCGLYNDGPPERKPKAGGKSKRTCDAARQRKRKAKRKARRKARQP